jgi:hypothetical protein
VKTSLDRRSFLKNSVIAGAAVTAGAAILDNVPSALAEPGNGHLTRGDLAILRWLAAAEHGTRRNPGQRSVHHSQSADSWISLNLYRRKRAIYQRCFTA